MSIMTPIVIPLAWNVGGGSSGVIPVAVGAMFSGAIFGDNCSPISDTTVLASTFAGSDLIDHVRTQLYYAGTIFLATIVVLLLYGVTGIPSIALFPIGLLLLIGLVYAFSEFDMRRKGIELKPGASRVSHDD